MKWYHTYTLHPELDRTEAIICQHLYCPNIRKDVLKEVTNYDVWQRTERSTKKYVKISTKLSEDKPRNNIFLYLVGPYRILRKWKDPLILKSVTMIDPVTRWFEVTQYSNKKEMTIENLVETVWLARYPWLV